MKLKLTLVVLLLSSFVLSSICDDVDVEVEDEDEDEDEEEEEEVVEVKEIPKPPDHVEFEVLKESKKECQQRVTDHQAVGIHFVGKLASDGSIFFDSRANNAKDEWTYFPLGVGESIKGLEIGLWGMCTHDIRRIVVEPEWIKNGRNIFDPEEGVIPRDQKLIFEVEVMHITPNYVKGLPNMFKVYDTDKDQYLTVDEIAQYLIDEGQFGPAGPLINKLAQEVIDKDDMNQDGRVQWKEFTGPKHDEL